MAATPHKEEFFGMFCNVDGLTKQKLDELADIARRNENMLFIFAAEVKQQQGIKSMELDIHGFTCTESLRETSQTGGIVLWSRDHTGNAILPWKGLDKTPAWMESERSCVLVNNSQSRIACCGIYLRVESPRSLDFYKSNVSLLEHLEKEKDFLEAQGYSIGIFGDARVESGPNFQFSKLSTHSKQQRQTSDRVHRTEPVILSKPNELER